LNKDDAKDLSDKEYDNNVD